MSKYVKSQSLSFIALDAHVDIDTDANTLLGAQVAMLGEAKGHGFELDDVSLDQIVALGNATSKGVKTRFGHPSLCTPGLGTVIGTRTNFLRDGDYVRADLHISKAANPEYARHILEMSKLHPDKIGNSIVFSGDIEERLNDDGTPKLDDNGNKLLPVARIKHLHAVDVVDEPALGDGMFSEPIEGIDLSPRDIVKLRDAMDKPGALKRLLNMISGKNVSGPTNDAGPEVSKKEVPVMELTLLDFKANYPEVAKAHAAELSVGHTEAAAASLEKGVEQERARISKFLSRCKPYHFEATKEHPNGFVSHAVDEGLSYDECLEGLMELNEKYAELSSLQTGDEELSDVSSAPPFEGALSGEAEAAASLAAAAKRREAN